MYVFIDFNDAYGISKYLQEFIVLILMDISLIIFFSDEILVFRIINDFFKVVWNFHNL